MFTLCALVTGAEQVDLRGYGRVAAHFAPGVAVFACEDAARADALLGKLLADAFWDAGDAVRELHLRIGGRDVVARAWESYGVLVAARDGATVVAVGGDDEAALRDALTRAPALGADARFAPEHPYPRWLDFFDLRAFKAYVHPMSSPAGEGLASHWPFAQRFGLGGLGSQELSFAMQSPARGVVDFTGVDYELREAAAHGGMAVIGVGGGELPLWAYDRRPDTVMRSSPSSLGAAWGAAAAVGARYDSWWTPMDQRLGDGLGFIAQAMRRYGDNAALGGWHLYAGAPGAEFGLHGVGQLWDHSRAGQDGFRAWLRARDPDLAALGRRWYGDAAVFGDWSDVSVPDIDAFFGALGPDCLRLQRGWSWLRCADQEPPSSDDPRWRPIDLAPSHAQAFRPWGTAFYRIEFDAADWLARHPGEPWLVCDVGVRSATPTAAWLNGERIIAEATTDDRALATPLAGRLRARNELVIRAPGEDPSAGGQFHDGKIYGPVFITATRPARYPDLGPHGNARWADLMNWLVDSNMHAHRPMLEVARTIDPERPIVLSGDANEFSDRVADLAATFGCAVQHTGREAWYHPWWAGLGLLAGFYGSGEESATTKPEALERELGWTLFDADSNHDLFWDLEDYQRIERETGWFTAHARLLRLFGKHLRRSPEVCVLRSARTMRLGIPTPWNWDIGRGELQAAHWDNAYASERELLAGLTDRCPVLIDSGTELMEEDVLAALHRYVERGGTFVALHATGLRTEIDPDARPIARLTGFAPRSRGPGRIAFDAHPPLLRGWAERAFETGGCVLDPRDDGLLPGERPVVIARWEDGSAAAAVRRIGKGRVLVLGTWFWRDGHDPAGTLPTQDAIRDAFFAMLFGECGVVRTADASNRAVWARAALTKNGLQDWLVARNDSNQEQRADLRLRLTDPGARVVDLVSGQAVVTTLEDGMAVIADQRFTPFQTRIYAARRASLVGGLSTWWSEKTTYWKRDRTVESAPLAAAARRDGDPIPCERWRVAADGAVAAGDAWLRPGFSDAAWRELPTGPVGLVDTGLAGYHGDAAYRFAFTVPRSWRGRRILLRLYAFNTPIVYDRGEFFVNGAKVADYRAHGWSQAYVYDVTDRLVDGDNVVAVRVSGGQEFSGVAAAVWLEAEPELAPALDLGGDWSVMRADYRVDGVAPLPGRPTGRALVREFDMPDGWRANEVMLRLSMPEQWLGAILINGQAICSNGFMHPFPPRVDIALGPYLVAGRNRIELWPFRTVPGFNGEQAAETEMPIDAIAVGCRR